MKALSFERFGGPEVLVYGDVPGPVLVPGHAIVRLEAIGLNFADVYRRQGRYHLDGKPPYIAGYEGAGVVEGVADHPQALSGIRLGDRVAFADSPRANAGLALVALERLIPLPDDISFDTAASALLQGLTAQYLARDSHRVREGERVLVHAAAGGVGLLLTQVARLHGAKVVGLVSSEAKAAAARNAGAELVLLYRDDWLAEARRFSREGSGIDVAYDSVGSTLSQSFDVVRIGGHVVFFGMAGGDPPYVDPRMLMDTSKTLTGGDLWNVLRTREDRVTRSAELFSWIRSGRLSVRVGGRFALSEGAAAHAALESREVVGKIVLTP